MATSSSSSYSISGNPYLAQLAEQNMQAQYSWGQDQFQKNDQLTSQVVGDLMQTYGQLSGLGSEMMNQYQTMFQPEYQNLVNDANNYSSQARIQQAMGAAESGVAQEFNGQRNAALTDLQEFGIDPSSGRYDQLDKSERVQQAAAQAGAGFQAEQATEATGRGLRSEALQLGSVMPSQATAAYNAASGAAQAGENAKLANSQEGVNMMGSPIQWGDMGMQLKTSTSGSRSSGGNDSSGGNKGPNLTPGDMNPNGSPGRGPGSPGRGPGSPGGNGNPDYAGPNPNADIQPVPGQDTPPVDTPPVDTSDPNGNGQTPDDSGNYSNPEGGGAYGAVDATGGSPDDQGGGGGDVSYDQPSYDDSGYAEGGAIPYSKSPSHGRVTDDVPARINGKEPARLNAGEFVMPRHAVQWKGEKFFHDLIERSKKQRGASTARPTMKPAIETSRHEGVRAHV